MCCMRMSCSADYYLEWNSRLDQLYKQTLTADFLQLETLQMRENILLITLEALASRCYQHWQHRLFGAYYELQS
jgi:hypothetical protein